MQALLTAPLESTHLSWRSSLLTHVLCGQLAGLERQAADAEACSLSTCARVGLQAYVQHQLRKQIMQARRNVK